MNENSEPKLPDAVSVSEMARMMGLSRQRLWQLQQAGLVPKPLHDKDSKRPYYPLRLQQVCLEVRRSNRGLNGKRILFYSRRVSHADMPVKQQAKPRARTPKIQPKHAETVEMLGEMGLEVSADDVGGALAELYPDGTEGIDEGVVLGQLFRHLKAKK